jgi:hypothetical protein
MNPTRVVGTFPARNLVGQAGKGKGPAILSSRALWRRLAHRFFDLHQRQQSYSCAYSKLALYPTTSLDPRASKADGLTGSGSSAFSWMFTLTVAKFNSKSKPRSDLREQFYLAAVAQKPETTDAVPQYESASSDGNRVRNRLPQENANRKKLPLRENTSSNRVFQHQHAISFSERTCTASRAMVTAAGTSESGCTPARDPLPCRCAVAWRFFYCPLSELANSASPVVDVKLPL